MSELPPDLIDARLIRRNGRVFGLGRWFCTATFPDTPESIPEIVKIARAAQWYHSTHDPVTLEKRDPLA